MPKARWNGVVIADAADSEVTVLEGNVYFPSDAVQHVHLRPSEHHTTCPWKGVASYYDVVVAGQVNKDAAWYYPEPEDAAREIKNRIAFWHGVETKA